MELKSHPDVAKYARHDEGFLLIFRWFFGVIDDEALYGLGLQFNFQTGGWEGAGLRDDILVE